ncbi:hypothetical protein [Parapedobacter koreensis]|uniref:hypothetical protein n=1 Tax=Parapedobacter koreensis TaxID=332977 RepID=UPI00115FB93A|nr:hypothetical protein [Parapedobacter koreensis]
MRKLLRLAAPSPSVAAFPDASRRRPQVQGLRFASSGCLTTSAAPMISVGGCFAADGFLCGLSRSGHEFIRVRLRARNLRTPLNAT